MFRITCTLKNGYDFSKIVFTLNASNVALALQDAMTAMRQLGFKPSDYEMMHSTNLEETDKPVMNRSLYI